METAGAKWRASEVYLSRGTKANGKKRHRSGAREEELGSTAVVSLLWLLTTEVSITSRRYFRVCGSLHGCLSWLSPELAAEGAFYITSIRAELN